MNAFKEIFLRFVITVQYHLASKAESLRNRIETKEFIGKNGRLFSSESKGDVPGWVLVVLMTTALVTGIWSIAAPKLTTILRNSLDAMGGIK